MARLTAAAVAEAIGAAADTYGGSKAIGALVKGAGYSVGSKDALAFRRAVERTISGQHKTLTDKHTAALMRGMAGAGVTTSDPRLLRATDDHKPIAVKLTLEIKRFPTDNYERRSMVQPTPLRAILRHGYGPAALQALPVPADYLGIYEGDTADYSATWDGVTHSGEFDEDTLKDAELDD